MVIHCQTYTMYIKVYYHKSIQHYRIQISDPSPIIAYEWTILHHQSIAYKFTEQMRMKAAKAERDTCETSYDIGQGDKQVMMHFVSRKYTQFSNILIPQIHSNHTECLHSSCRESKCGLNMKRINTN
eukprot:411556_1